MDDTPENSKDGHSSQLRAYFEVRSPYSRLGLHKLANAGFGGELINFTGPPDGIEFANPTENPHKLAYYQQDVFRMTLRANLPLALPNPFDPDFTASGLAFEAAKRDGFALPFALAMSDARWGEGRNLSDADVLADCANSVGWTGLDLQAHQTDPQIAVALTEARAKINSDGIFGVPFLIDGHEKYWGQDRFDLWLETL